VNSVCLDCFILECFRMTLNSVAVYAIFGSVLLLKIGLFFFL
jgi:hypothetical protein